MIAPPEADGKTFLRAKTPHKRGENAQPAITNSLKAP
jgi:hypothetical protein